MKRIITSLLFISHLFCTYAQDIITLDLQEGIDIGEYSIDEQGKWNQTYNTQINTLSFNRGMFNFSHIIGQEGGMDYVEGMSYWDGFTLCNSGDTNDYGENGSSDGWVPQQWGCMAGGGLNSNLEAQNGRPYLVAYWGFHMEEEEGGKPSCMVEFDNKTHKVKGVYICNHPWPYYGNIHGDGFCSALDYKDSYFTLTAHGMLHGNDTGSKVTLTLAENNGDGIAHSKGWPKGLVQSAEWQWMDLTSLGLVDAVYFTMESSDADPKYGINTAAYFCLDQMQIYEHEDIPVPVRPSGLYVSKNDEQKMTIRWNYQNDATTYDVYLNNKKLGSTSYNIYILNDLSPYTEYSIKIIAKNSYGESDPVSMVARTLDLTAPSSPTNIIATAESPYKVQLKWDASKDNVGVTKYAVYKDGKIESRPKNNSYTLTGLDPCTKYTITIAAMDASGNMSEKSSIEIVTSKLPNALEGDVNGDNILDMADIVALTDIIIGKNKSKSMMGDMNGDKNITVTDVVILIGKLRK